MTMLRHRRGQPRSLSNQVAADLGRDAFGVGVTDNAAFTAFLDGVEHRLGPLDVLVNNAGIMLARPIDAEDEAMTARAVAINLEAVIHGTREAVRRMTPRRTGHIVNVSSAVSKVAGSHCATYVATKFGVAGFSEAVAIELRGTGVEMSLIRPWLCHTELTSGFAGLRGMPFIDPQEASSIRSSGHASKCPCRRAWDRCCGSTRRSRSAPESPWRISRRPTTSSATSMPESAPPTSSA